MPNLLPPKVSPAQPARKHRAADRVVSRVLVIAILTPWLVILGLAGSPASAADSYGDVHTVVFDFGNWDPTGLGGCTLNTFYSASSSSVPPVQVTVPSYKCGGGFDAAYNDWGASHVGFTFNGTSPTGGNCSYSSGTMSGFHHGFSGAFSATGGSTAGDCSVYEVCISAHVAFHLTPDSDENSCVTANLGPVPGVGPDLSGCPSISSVTKPTIGAEFVQGSSAYKYATFSVTGSATTPSGYTLQPYVIVRTNPTSGGYSPNVTVLVGGGAATGVPNGAGTGTMGVAAQTASTVTNYSFWYRSEPANGYTESVIGFGYFSPRDGETSGSYLTHIALPQSDPTGRVGVNSPTHCDWYWGEALATTVPSGFESTATTPAGPVTDSGSGSPTPPTDPGVPDPAGDCGFSFTVPSSWASGGLCELAGLLGSVVKMLSLVVDAINGLPGQLIGALLDGLGNLFQTLFVPDGDHMKAKVNELQTAFTDSSPGEWVSALSGLVPSGSSSCDGPHVEFHFHGADYSGYPMSACTGTLSTASTVVRLALSASLVVSGAYACVNGLGLGFGFSLRRSSGGDSA